MENKNLEDALVNALSFIWEECNSNSDFIELAKSFRLTESQLEYLGFETQAENFGVEDLTESQLLELKQNYYCNKHNNVSYGELANIENLVSDSEIYEEYSGIIFTKEDFSN